MTHRPRGVKLSPTPAYIVKERFFVRRLRSMHAGNSGGKAKVHPLAWIVRASALAYGLTGIMACDAPPPAQNAEVADQGIFGGVRDDDATAKSAVVALRIKRANNYELCSGALIAPNVVLTARHCVARIVSESVSCTEDGTSSKGVEHFTDDELPADIGIFLGAAPSFSKPPVALGRSIIASDTKVLCNADIAILVLDRKIENVEPLALRMTANARVGESIRAVGYGANDAKTPMGTRFRREQVPVLAVGKGISESSTRLGEHEFEVGKSICEGDSGGPAISELTGAVIGIVSRGGECSDDFGHVYTSPAGFKALFDRAFADVGGAPLLEQNTPPENVAWDPTEAPEAKTPPPNDQAPPQEGCSTAPHGSAGGGGILLALALVAVTITRRSARTSRCRTTV
jgi:hypothetical protein